MAASGVAVLGRLQEPQYLGGPGGSTRERWPNPARQALDCTGLVPKPVDMQCSHHGWPWSIPGPATDPVPSSTWNLGLTSWVRATFPCPPDHCHPILPILPMVRSHNAPTWEQRVNPSVETSGSLASHPSSFTCSCWPPSMGFSARRE